DLLFVASLKAPKHRVQAHVADERRLRRARVLREDVDFVVAAEEEQAELLVLVPVFLDERLPVVINGRGGHARAGRGEHRAEPRVEPRAARADREAPALRDGSLGERAKIDEVEL